jgi:hypothetical protein
MRRQGSHQTWQLGGWTASTPRYALYRYAVNLMERKCFLNCRPGPQRNTYYLFWFNDRDLQKRNRKHIHKTNNTYYLTRRDFMSII